MNNETEENILKKLRRDLRKFPVRPHVGIGGIIIVDNKLLLIKRKFDPDSGKWAIPGGHLNLGEECKSCAEREILEETTIKAISTDKKWIVDKIMRDESNRIIYHYVLVNYELEIHDDRFKNGIPELIPHDDAIDLKFVPFEKLSEFELTDSMIDLLQQMKIF